MHHVQAEQERTEDIRVTKEYVQMIDKQDEERNNFFKNNMRKPNEATKMQVENVLKEMECKRKFEEERILYYGTEKERK